MPKKYIKSLLIAIPLALIFSQLIPALLYSDMATSLKIQYHSFQTRNVERIQVTDGNSMGNTVNNINNYGHGVKDEEQFFYVEDGLNLVRSPKDFGDKHYLIQQSSGTGISRLNMVEDWIFYSQGKSYNRMKTDGTQQETIFQMGYPLDVHLKGNWIYFRNASDRFTPYRMDVNGQNLERVVNQSVSDIALYENRLYYSYQKDEEGLLASVDLQGNDKRIKMNIPMKDLVIWENYYYFIGHDDYRLYRNKMGETDTPQLLVGDKVSSYVLTENDIYYSLHSHDVGYPGDGLYKMDLDGSNNTLLLEAKRVEGLSQLDHWIFFASSDKNTHLTQKKLDLLTDEIVDMD